MPAAAHPADSATPHRVRAALAGGPPLLPPDWPPGLPPPPGTAVAVATSGSTGRPKWVALSRAALAASAQASASRLGGAGRWLLALPTAHIAGLNVVVRAVLAGGEPEAMPPGPFTPAAFLRAAARLGPGPKFTALVPTQLRRLVRAAESGPGALAGLAQALAGFDAVLVGGAAPDPAVVARARALGVRVVETYGAAETAGGCVYDGLPLDGVAVRLGAAARIEIAGPVLALGHVLPPGSPARHPADDAAAHPADDAALAHAHPADDAAAHPADDAALAAAPVRPAPPGLATEAADGGFVTEAGRTWFRSSDLGRMGADGRLDCLGRADDVIVTGGVKVPPGPVERVVRAQAGVRDALVLGMPDPEWGEAVVALIVPEPAYPADPARVREAVRRHLGPAHAPRRVVRIGSLPTLASGKVDRAAARAFVTGAADG